MGDVIVKQALFPAPDPARCCEALSDDAALKQIIWDKLQGGMPGGGVLRPFLWLKVPGASTTILYFHANGEDLSNCRSHLRRLCTQLTVNVLGVEYPGYGLCPVQDQGTCTCSQYGSTTVRGIDQAAIHALQFLVSRQGIPASQVVLHGHSLGSGPALRLARYARDILCWSVGGLVLQSPFISIAQVAVDYGGKLGPLLVPNYYNNIATLRELCWQGSADATKSWVPGELGSRQWIPMLIVHGEKDGVVAPYHGRRLLEEALRCGHPAVEAVFPSTATHCSFESMDHLLQPIKNFMKCHLSIPWATSDSPVRRAAGCVSCCKARELPSSARVAQAQGGA
mmetsp:Transcript_52634/g.118566  ORF Transcript_52634/g.118566 Transcript_52634/m.118566 type:complete len:339 (+) Transcript_52634:69-1085(+)